MATVIMQGHREKNGLLELLRLFYGAAAEGEDGLVGGASEPPRITSRITPLSGGGIQVDTFSDSDRLSRILPEGMNGQRPHPLVRREIKRQLYELLSHVTGRSFPYGSLTGIRPTRLAAEGLARSSDQNAVRRHLESDFGVAPVKSALLVETAAREQSILTGIDPASALIYMNIPFCPTRCSYCSFTCETTSSQPIDLDAYVDAMVAEAAALASHLNRPVSALYVGGGTPTILSAAQLERLLGGILPRISISPETELTVEAGRPDTIDPEKLAVIRASGVQRICINPQTLHERTLTMIGRRHTVEDTRRAFTEARQAGFEIINCDLIAGLPGETPDDFMDSVQTLIGWAPENVTIHTLSYKRKSELTRTRLTRNDQIADGLQSVETLSAEWSNALDLAHGSLQAAGLAPYYLYRQKDMVGGLENTGYARPGTECRYNVGMMSDERMVVGIGAGAMSKYLDADGLRRLPAPRDLKTYLQMRENATAVKIRTLFGTA